MMSDEFECAFKIYSAIKCPVGRPLSFIQALFAENHFTVTEDELAYCMHRAKEVGLIKILRSGRCRCVRNVCDSHIKGLFRKYLDEKRAVALRRSTTPPASETGRRIEKTTNLERNTDQSVSRTSIFQNWFPMAIRNIGGSRGGSTSSLSHEDVLIDCWNSINEVLEDVIDQESANLGALRDKINSGI